MQLIPVSLQAALDLLADLMTNSRECLKEGLVLLVRFDLRSGASAGLQMEDAA